MNAPAATLVAGRTVPVDDFPVELSWSAASDALVVAGGEGRLYRLQRDAGEALLLGTHAPGLLGAAWQPKGRQVATAGPDGGVRLWNAAEPAAPPRVLHRGTRWPAGLAWRADGERLAFATGKTVQVLDAAGAPQLALDGHSCTLSHLAWRGRDELVAAGNGALFVDRTDGTGKMTQYVLEGAPLTLALSPDLKIVANGLADGTINFRYLNSQKRSRMSGYEGKVDQTEWSANSRLLATSSSGASSIVVWDFGGKGPEGSDPLQLECHEERIESLAWQAGGAHLVSAGRDWRVVLWRPGSANRKPLQVQLLDGPAGIARWSPDGRHLAVAQPAGKIRFFALSA